MVLCEPATALYCVFRTDVLIVTAPFFPSVSARISSSSLMSETCASGAYRPRRRVQDSWPGMYNFTQPICILVVHTGWVVAQADRRGEERVGRALKYFIKNVPLDSYGPY